MAARSRRATPTPAPLFTAGQRHFLPPTKRRCHRQPTPLSLRRCSGAGVQLGRADRLRSGDHQPGRAAPQPGHLPWVRGGAHLWRKTLVVLERAADALSLCRHRLVLVSALPCPCVGTAFPSAKHTVAARLTRLCSSLPGRLGGPNPVAVGLEPSMRPPLRCTPLSLQQTFQYGCRGDVSHMTGLSTARSAAVHWFRSWPSTAPWTRCWRRRPRPAGCRRCAGHISSVLEPGGVTVSNSVALSHPVRCRCAGCRSPLRSQPAWPTFTR